MFMLKKTHDLILIRTRIELMRENNASLGRVLEYQDKLIDQLNLSTKLLDENQKLRKQVNSLLKYPVRGPNATQQETSTGSQTHQATS